MDTTSKTLSRTEPTISYPFVAALCEAIDGHENVVERGLRKFGLNDIEEESGRVSLRRYIGLFEWLAEALNRPYLGLELSMHAGPETLGAIGYMFLGAQNLEIAVNNLGHYLLAVQDSSQLYLDVDREYACVHYEILDNRITERRHDTEYSLGYVWHLMQICSPDKIQLTMVEFEHDRPSDVDGPYRRLFGAPVLFRRRANRLHFRTEQLRKPSRSGDPILFPILEAQMQELASRNKEILSFSDQVQSCLSSENLAQGVRARGVANQLGISEATLHRRLKLEGKGFKAISDQAAKSHASYLISQKTISIATIARRLGYSETACLTRAFRRWYGMSPRDYRKSLS